MAFVSQRRIVLPRQDIHVTRQQVELLEILSRRMSRQKEQKNILVASTLTDLPQALGLSLAEPFAESPTSTPMPIPIPTPNPTPRALIPLRSKVCRRFYEPIVLLVALNKSCRHDASSPEVTDLLPDTTRSPESAFQCFVNKLGHICDSERGGATVTAFGVLKLPNGTLQYRFGSNQLMGEYLDKARLYIIKVLDLLGQTATENLRSIDSQILRMALSYCSSRVSSYVRTVEAKLGCCIECCERDENSDEISLLAEKLTEVQSLAHVINENSMDNSYPSFSNDCERLIRALELLYKSDCVRLIEAKRTGAEMSDRQHWYGFHHAAGRLRAYLHAVPIFISVRRRWPELFRNFEVTYVPSSKPDPNPMQSGSRRGGVYADEIIGRMTSNKSMIASYRAHAELLQKFRLDERIQEQSTSKRFKPFVHAEALVLGSLVSDQMTDAPNFFGGWKYIGCSKPTCRLCHYFFAAHPSGVQVRPTHRNVYANWKLPDVYSDQGPDAPRQRERLIDTMLLSIRGDAFRILEQKQPERKIHDSNDDPTTAILSVSSVAPIENSDDDLVSVMGVLSVESSQQTDSIKSLLTVLENGQDSIGTSLVGDDDDVDEEEGGVCL